MLKLRWTLSLIAVLIVGAAAYTWYLSENRTGASMLASVENRLDTERPDFDAVLREIELGLDLARAEGDDPTREALLETRAQVHMRRRSFQLSLDDSLALLAITSGEDEKRHARILSLAARAASGAKEPELALDLGRRVLDHDADHPGIHALLGRLELRLVEIELEELREILDGPLPTRESRLGMELARQAAALPARHPARRRAFASLEALLPDSVDAEDLRKRVEGTGTHLTGAREAFVRGIDQAPQADVLEGIQDVFACGTERRPAAILGLIALDRHLQPSFTGVLVRTALALRDMEREHVAKGLIVRCLRECPALQSNYRRLDPQMLLDWCSLLHEFELWPELNRAATALDNGRKGRRIRLDLGTLPQFFIGVSRKGMGNPAGALTSFNEVERLGPRRDAFPGERTLSILARADVYKLFKQRKKELETLREAVGMEPPPRDGGPAALAHGEIMLRLAEDCRERGDWYTRTWFLTHALSYLPTRRFELEPQWYEAGHRHITAKGGQIDAFIQYLDGRGLQLPVGKVEVYHLMMVGTHRLEQRRYHAAHIAARRTLEDFPGFPLALETDAEALLHLNRETEAIDRMLALAEDGSGAPDLLVRLREIPEEHFTPTQRLRWYRVDPRGAALREVARRLMGEGETDLALAAIRPHGTAAIEARDRLAAAELLASLDRWPEARAALDRIEPEEPGFEEAAGLALLAGLHTRRYTHGSDPLREALQRILIAPHLKQGAFPAAVDALLGSGLLLEARGVLQHLEENHAVHEPGLLLRSGIVEVLDGNAVGAQETLDRTEAYLDAGEAQIGRILLAFDTNDAVAAREEALRLLATDFAQDPLRAAILNVITGDSGVAYLKSIEAFDATEGDDPRAFLTRILCEVVHLEDSPDVPEESVALLDHAGAGRWKTLASLGGTTTPDGVAALLLGIEGGPWAAWSLKRLRALPPSTRIQPWPSLLEATCLIELGLDLEAEEILTRLTLPEESFAFAWDLLEDIALARYGGDHDAPALRELRRRRAFLMGTTDYQANEVRLLVAEECFARDRIDEGLEVLAEGTAEFPEHFEVAIALARGLVTAGRIDDALDEYDRLFDSFPEVQIEPLVPEVIDNLRDAAATGQLSEGEWWARLDALAAARPTDPALALELARRTAETASDDPDGGLARARDILERFRNRTDSVPVDSLRRGAGAEWVSFLSWYDPEAALELAAAELLADPPSLALWRAHAEALAAVGRRKDAIKDLETLLLIVRDPKAELLIARLMAELGFGPSLILPAVSSGPEDELPGVTLERLLILGRALVNGNPRDQRRGIEHLSLAWSRCSSTTPFGVQSRIGRDLSEALLVRNQPGDAERAAGILRELAALTLNPVRRDYYLALANLSSGK